MPSAMDKLARRKAAVIELLEAVTDERTITAVEETLAGNTHYALTTAQKKQLDQSSARYIRGEAKTFTPEQARSMARRAARE